MGLTNFPATFYFKPRENAVSISNRLQSDYDNGNTIRKIKCSSFQKRNWNSRVHNQPEGMKLSLRHVDIIRHWKRHPPRRYRDVLIFIYAFTKPIQDLLQTMNNSRSTSLPHRFSDTANRILIEYDSKLTSYTQYWLEWFQRSEDDWRPIVFFLHDLNENEWHCPVNNKEVMAVIMGFDRRSHYPRLYWPSQLERFHVSHLIERQTLWPTKYYPMNFTFHWKGSLNPWMVHSILGDQTIQPEHKSRFLESLIYDFKWMSFSYLCEREQYFFPHLPYPSGTLW